MRDITQDLLELIRSTSADLPTSVQKRLESALRNEKPRSAASGAMRSIINNIELTRRISAPICQDTGTPIFFVSCPENWNPRYIRSQIQLAVAEATKKNYLRPNAVEAISGKNTGNNLGDQNFPTIHFEFSEDGNLEIDLMLKGGGCENVSAQYSLPDEKLNAKRDLEGVRKVVLDAVFQAQGQGCAPGFLGVAIGGDRGSGYLVSKQALLRKIDDSNPDPELDALEKRITEESNKLGIGPMGFGGNSTILATKIKATHRLPASYFVTVSYMCWAFRHRKMIVKEDRILYDDSERIIGKKNKYSHT
jgi:fumarate hydratase, class I